VYPLPYTHPSLFGFEILVVGNAGEIMARIASETPMQLQLTFRYTEKEENSKGFVEDATGKPLPLFTLPSSHAPKLIGTLGDLEESSTTSELKT
jgi:hypothetical protein